VNNLLPVKKAYDAKVAADALITASAALQTALNTANTNVTTLTTNDTDHETVRVAKVGLQTTAKTNWDNGLTAITTADTTLKTEKLKKTTDSSITVANVATGVAAGMRACHASGVGHASGAAYAAGVTGAAAYYVTNYLNCDSPTATTDKGYTKQVAVYKAVSDGSTYTTWKTAQDNLEKKATIYGKIKFTCM